MRVGNLGEIVFEASDEVVRTLSKTKRRRSPNRKTPPLFCDRARDRTSTVAKGRNPPHAKKNRAGIQRSESGPIAKKFPPQRSFRREAETEQWWEFLSWWRLMDSNHRPPACEAGALTS